MQWTEYIQQINRDEIDNNAIERYSLWRSQIMENINIRIGRKKMIYLYRLDPDILNEFCFYMPQYWDRLIIRAKMFDNKNDCPYEKKLQRAVMILYGVDPDIIPEEDIPMQLWWDGGLLNYLHRFAMEQWNDYSIPFENVVFAFNRFSGAISITVNDGSDRTFHLIPTDFVYPPDLKAIISGEHSQKKYIPIDNTGFDPINEENVTINEKHINDESEWLPM